MVLKDLQHIRYKRFFFSVNEYFLTDKASMTADINYCIQCSENINNTLNEFYTLLINLSQPEESIKQDIYHRTLTEINSFVGNQDYEYKLLIDFSDKDLNQFIRSFNQFAVEKKIRRAEVFRLKAYQKAGILAISYIKQKNAFLFINFYRLTKERAANINSFSVQESEKYFSPSHLGRAHRTLHWLDILEFKKAGVNYYDFCGWYSGNTDRALLNINTFKEQFTKNKVKEYTGVLYKNKFLIFILKILK